MATSNSAKPLVTVAIPVYKRLNYLPGALRAVAAQDYPNVELIVSDNGMNGSVVPGIVSSHFPRPYRFRQSPSSETLVMHYNHILSEASGEYFMILCDDDELTPNYVSELVTLLERNPRASVGIGQQEILDESGAVVRCSAAPLPERLAGADFIRAAFHTYEYRFEGFGSSLGRTADIRRCGGYPDFLMGTAADDTLLLKLCLDRDVVLSDRCAFRYRVYETSYGLGMSIDELAKAIKQSLRFLDSDQQFRDFARAHPDTWAALKGYAVKNRWQSYYTRWYTLYRRRLSRLQWVRAAFALPFIPEYYAQVISTLLEAGKYAVLGCAKRLARALRST